MDSHEALELIDQLIYHQTGKHLNDLEREVFVGSWDGKSYLEIYPLNPTYLEKYVGYKLWQKISQTLNDKVTKKTIRGAIERYKQQENTLNSDATSSIHSLNPDFLYRVFISHAHSEPCMSLARQLESALLQAGHQVFLASWEVTPPQLYQPETDLLSKIDHALRQCHYLILLLSPQSPMSEMVIEELRRVRELQDAHPQNLPYLLPIWVNVPSHVPLNHDLKNYLLGTVQRDWNNSEDTPNLSQEILTILNQSLTHFQPQNFPSALDNWDQRESFPFYPISSAIPSPLPVAEPEVPSGQVRLESAFYIKRVPDEDQCYQEIHRPGSLIRIKAARQMGKTSLMARILEQARETGYRTVPLSFQHADKAIFNNLNNLLQWLCAKVARKLKVSAQVDAHWSNTFGSKDNCTAFFEDCLLSESDYPLVLGLDEVDRVFQYPNIADDFFSLLRAWYEEANYGGGDSDLWEKLRLVIVHSTEVYIPLDINQSPFNVGLPIELTEFKESQVEDLAHRHGLNWGVSEVQHLMRIVGGHPYLVRVALYHIVHHQISLEKLVEIATTESGIYGDHLRRHLWNLQQHPELAQGFSKVVNSPQPVELESVLAFKLHSLGLVHLQGNEVIPRFELYRDYFRHRLVQNFKEK